MHWHFFATSHGKGVVDGIGGSVKGSVHRKILAGRVVQTVKQVAEIAQDCHTNVIIQYVSADEIAEDKNMLDEQWKHIKTLPGTQKIHSIMSANDGKVRAAEVSTGISHHYTLFGNSKVSPLAPAVASSSISQQNQSDHSSSTAYQDNGSL